MKYPEVRPSISGRFNQNRKETSLLLTQACKGDQCAIKLEEESTLFRGLVKTIPDIALPFPLDGLFNHPVCYIVHTWHLQFFSLRQSAMDEE